MDVNNISDQKGKITDSGVAEGKSLALASWGRKKGKLLES